jgi:hypothetical protein
MSDIRDFGAVGDGRQDDTQAIQHAIQDGEGAIVFSPGVYRLTRTIHVDLDRRRFTGLTGIAGTVKLLMEGSGPALRLAGTHAGTAAPSSVEPNIFARQRMPMVQDLEIEGAHDDADGIELTGTMHSLLSGLLIHGCRHGIRLHQRNRNVLISHCHVYHNRGVGIFLDAVNLHQINIASSHVSYNRLGGIRITQSEIRNLQITGNDIEYNNHRSHDTAPEPTAEVYVDTSAPGSSVAEVTVASNTIQATPSPGGANLRIFDDGQGRSAPGIWTITGNVIGNQENNIHLAGCHDVVISGNNIYSCTERNLLVENSRQINVSGNNFRRHSNNLFTGVRFVRSRDCLIHGCSIRDEDPAGQRTGASLLELVECRRVTVANCHLLDGVPHGLHVVDSHGVSVQGCTIRDTRESRLSQAAVRWEGQGEQNLFQGNLVDAEPEAIQIDDSADVRQDGNRPGSA